MKAAATADSRRPLRRLSGDLIICIPFRLSRGRSRPAPRRRSWLDLPKNLENFAAIQHVLGGK